MKENLEKKLTIRLTNTQYSLIEEMAEAKKRKKTDLARVIIEEAIEEYIESKKKLEKFQKSNLIG